MSGAVEKTANDEIAIGRDTLRWWDPLLVLVFALVGLSAGLSSSGSGASPRRVAARFRPTYS